MEEIKIKGRLVFEIYSKNHWINSFPGAIPKLPMSESYLWIDSNGNSAFIGEDFMYAEEIESYPIKIYHLQRVAHNNPKNEQYLQKLNKLFDQ